VSDLGRDEELMDWSRMVGARAALVTGPRDGRRCPIRRPNRLIAGGLLRAGRRVAFHGPWMERGWATVTACGADWAEFDYIPPAVVEGDVITVIGGRAEGM
jgi:hypothetical protein